MSDVTVQLREYFDASVERITAEDIFAGRAVTGQVRYHESGPGHRSPVWASAYAFALTLLVLGGSLAAGLVLHHRRILTVGSGGVVTATGTTDLIGWVLVGLAAALGVAGLVFIGLALVDRTKNSRKEGAMATTIEAPGIERELESAHRANRWLIAAVVVLAIAVLALGAWVIYDLTTGSDTAGNLPADVEAVVNDYNNAWFNYDLDTFHAVVATTFTFTSGGATFDVAGTEDNIVSGEAIGFGFERGDVVAACTEQVCWVAQTGVLTTTLTPDGIGPGMSIIRLVNLPNSGWKVLSHEWVGAVPGF